MFFQFKSFQINLSEIGDFKTTIGYKNPHSDLELLLASNINFRKRRKTKNFPSKFFAHSSIKYIET